MENDGGFCRLFLSVYFFANALNFLPLFGKIFNEFYGMDLASFEQNMQVC